DRAFFLPRHLRHLGLVGIERLVHRDAARASFRRGLAPARLLRGELERRLVARVLAEERAAQLERVPLRGARDLVEEALGGEGGVRRADRAPPLTRPAELRRGQVAAEVGVR